MDCLFLSPQATSMLSAELPVYWLPVTGDGQLVTLAESAMLVSGAFALILPAEVCNAFAIKLPTQKARLLRQALPYAVEELLAEEVEHLHLSVGNMLADGRHRVVAIRSSLLKGWLQQLEALGLGVGSIYLDADLLPREGTQVLLQDQRGLLGGEGETRLAFGSENWPTLAEQVSTPITLRHHEQIAEPYRWLAQGLPQAVNLAQGEFTVRSTNHGRRHLRPLLIVAGAWLLLQLGFNLAQSWYWQHQAEHYALVSQQLYQELFPQDTRIVNLRAQFSEHLAQGAHEASSGFLSLLQQAAAAIANDAGLRVSQLDYSANRGDVALQVHAADFATLEQLRQRLIATGLAVQLGSAGREEQGVSARIVLGEQP